MVLWGFCATVASVDWSMTWTEAGAKTDGIRRRHSISSATFHCWRKKYGGIEADGAKQLRAEKEVKTNSKRELMVESSRHFACPLAFALQSRLAILGVYRQ